MVISTTTGIIIGVIALFMGMIFGVGILIVLGICAYIYSNRHEERARTWQLRDLLPFDKSE